MLIGPEYNRIKTIKGIKYYIIYKPWKVILLKAVKIIQKGLWYCGVAWHDPIFGECTPDFNCCGNCGREAWIKFPQKHYHKKYKPVI